jgi:hypothetical protein
LRDPDLAGITAKYDVLEEDMYNLGFATVMKTAGLSKTAVTLDQLRKATSALQKNTTVVRRSLMPDDISGGYSGVIRPRNHLPETFGLGPNTLGKTKDKDLESKLRQIYGDMLDWYPEEDVDQALQDALARTKAVHQPFMAGGRSTIYQGGSPAIWMKHLVDSGDFPSPQAQGFQNMLKSGPGQEAFNRSTLLHEGSEIGKQFGKRLFESHLSTRPMLQDMNIAATLRGPGSEAAGAIKDLRAPEVASLNKYVPGLERLNLGENRISRHAQKRIQQSYERSLDREGVKGIPGINAP